MNRDQDMQRKARCTGGGCWDMARSEGPSLGPVATHAPFPSLPGCS